MSKGHHANNHYFVQNAICLAEYVTKFIHLGIIFSVGFLVACSGVTKPYIPEQTIPVADGMARIILTRENQVAGAGSPIEILDIGENVSPNSMLACSYMREGDRLMDVRVLATAQYNFWVDAEFLWTNPNLVSSVSCGTSNKACGAELKNELMQQEGFLRGDVGILLSDESYALRLTAHKRSRTRPTGMLLGDAHAWTSKPVVSENAPPLIDPSIALLEKARLQEFETVQIPAYSGGNTTLQGLRIPDSKLPLVFHSVIKYKPDPGNAAALQRGDFFSVSGRKSIQIIDNRYIDRNVQLIGRVRTGDTLIWDRKPGTLRLGAVWHDGINFMTQDIKLEPGKRYYIHYTTRFPPKSPWEFVKAE